MITATPIFLFLLLLMLGMPIGFNLAVSGAIGVWLTIGVNGMLGILQTTPYRSAASALLATVPLFILMAEFLARGSIVRNVFAFANRCLGHIPGGLALATVGANVVFATLSGSSTAAAAAMAKISVPQMRDSGYDEKLALGTVAIAGTLAIMIPPSLGFIIYGVLTGTSIGKLFLAGVIPGIVTALAYGATILIWVRRRPEVAPPAARSNMRERMDAFGRIWPALLLVALILGGIYSGIITATEAAGVGALGALIVSVLWGGLRKREFGEALESTARSTSMIFAIVIGAMIFGYYLSATQLPQQMVEWVATLHLSRWAIMGIVVLIYIVLGFFVDQLAAVVLTLPLTFPLVVSLGYDPVWFGVILVKTSEIGLVTPPMGMNVFVVAGATKSRIETTFQGVMPFLLAEAAVLLLLLFIPELSLLIPDLMD